MKKEVVHVPTRELAEEVLRVAKENGLMKDLDVIAWKYFKIDTYFRPNEYGGFDYLRNAKRNGDTIITAEEFLDRYKKDEVIIKPLNERYDECLEELDVLVDINNQLRKENESLKQQLKAIEDQPKVGDVCLFWDSNHKTFAYGKLLDIKQGVNRPYVSIDKFVYSHCIKATDENIQLKIKELQDDTKTT